MGKQNRRQDIFLSAAILLVSLLLVVIFVLYFLEVRIKIYFRFVVTELILCLLILLSYRFERTYDEILTMNPFYSEATKEAFKIAVRFLMFFMAIFIGIYEIQNMFFNY